MAAALHECPAPAGRDDARHLPVAEAGLRRQERTSRCRGSPLVSPLGGAGAGVRPLDRAAVDLPPASAKAAPTPFSGPGPGWAGNESWLERQRRLLAARACPARLTPRRCFSSKGV